MDITNVLSWWLHFLFGIFSYLTGVQIFPEQLPFFQIQQAHNNNNNNNSSNSSFCQQKDIRTSLDELSSSSSFLHPTNHHSSFFQGQVLTPSDGFRFGQARDQYASVTFAQQLNPSVIILVKTETDVQAAVVFAARCGYSVSIRSGGHSYLGTSSCDSSSKGKCLQIDVTGLNQQQQQQQQQHPHTTTNQVVTLGPGNRLQDAAEFLHKHGQFLPTGECPGVALGGHMQTGGFGLFTRHFGPFASRVESFRIVLADGSLHHVEKPKEDEETNDNNSNITTNNNNNATRNDDLFYAVLGGASGSWGVVTEMTLNTIRDDDYFSVYWKLAYWWDTPQDTDGIVNMMRVWAQLAKEKKDDWRWGTHWSVVGAKNVPGLGNRIQLEGAWVAPKHQAHEYDFDFFQTIDNACTNCRRFRYINVTEPLSEIWRHRYIRTRINKGTGREFPVPYTRAMQQLEDFPEPHEMENITREIASLLPHRFSPHFMISQLTTIRGADTDPTAAAAKIALPWPKDSLGVTLDYFWIPPTQYIYDYEELSRAFGQKIIANAKGKDHRMYWAAYDAPSLEMDWPQYFDSEHKYRRLQDIKLRYDPQNIFQNQMSIPLPLSSSSSREEGCSTTTNTNTTDESCRPELVGIHQKANNTTRQQQKESGEAETCTVHEAME